MLAIIKHVAHEGPGIIADYLDSHKYRWRNFELNHGAGFPEISPDLQAVVIMGGPMNVDEENIHPFLKGEVNFIQKVLAAKIPVLGICLGAQLLAKALGTPVVPASRPELGWGRVELTEYGKNDPFFQGLSENPEVFQWHQDTFEIPEGGFLLAKSAVCPQAFRFGDNAYGVQFHFEVTTRMIRSWVAEYLRLNPAADDSRLKEIMAESAAKENNFIKQGQIILGNFLKITEKPQN